MCGPSNWDAGQTQTTKQRTESMKNFAHGAEVETAATSAEQPTPAAPPEQGVSTTRDWDPKTCSGESRSPGRGTPAPRFLSRALAQERTGCCSGLEWCSVEGTSEEATAESVAASFTFLFCMPFSLLRVCACASCGVVAPHLRFLHPSIPLRFLRTTATSVFAAPPQHPPQSPAAGDNSCTAVPSAVTAGTGKQGARLSTQTGTRTHTDTHARSTSTGGGRFPHPFPPPPSPC